MVYIILHHCKTIVLVNSERQICPQFHPSLLYLPTPGIVWYCQPFDLPLLAKGWQCQTTPGISRFFYE